MEYISLNQFKFIICLNENVYYQPTQSLSLISFLLYYYRLKGCHSIFLPGNDKTNLVRVVFDA